MEILSGRLYTILDLTRSSCQKYNYCIGPLAGIEPAALRYYLVWSVTVADTSRYIGGGGGEIFNMFRCPFKALNYANLSERGSLAGMKKESPVVPFG